MRLSMTRLLELVRLQIIFEKWYMGIKLMGSNHVGSLCQWVPMCSFRIPLFEM